MKAKNYILSLITISLIASCGKKEEKKEVQQEEILTVQVQPVVSKSLSIPITGSGVLASKSEMKLAFKTGGMIKRVYVNEGESVRKGELLAELDLSEIDAQVNQAKIGLAKATRDLERVKRLYADEATTLQNVQDATSGFEAATQSVEVAQFNQKLSKIYSPSSGRILRKIAEQGELITPFSPAFILATGESAYIVNIGLSDKDLVKIKIGNKANVKIDAYPEAIFTATVTQIAQAVNPATGTFEVELELAKTAGYKLVSGFVAKAELIPNNVPTSLAIPIESLVEANGNQAFIFVLNSDNQSVTRKEISIGNIIENQVEVKSGLSENEQVVVRGGGFLSDKSKVKIAR